MKKQDELRIVILLKKIFNFRWWVDYDRLKSFTQYIIDLLKKYFIPAPKPETDESFETAQQELNLSEAELLSKQKGLYRLSVLMSVIAVFLFAYSMYHLYYAAYKAVVLSLVVMFLALTMAFRYHFWYFQIKNRRLGCSFNEWFRVGLLGGKHG